MTIVAYPSGEFEEILKSRRPNRSPQVIDTVAAIIEDVRRRGDAAVLENAQRFDSPKVSRLLVDSTDYEEVAVDRELDKAIAKATQRIADFHYDQAKALIGNWPAPDFTFGPDEDLVPHLDDSERRVWRTASTLSGDYVGQRVLPVSRAGIYAPGGRTSYPSSILMNALPAVAAGVNRLVIATPSGPEGALPAPILRAIQAVDQYGGFTKQLTAIMAGGAAAIAAMALGTESVPRCDVVVGPGNEWVNEAKRQLWGECGFDGYAGPSEVAVWVDETANPPFAAADLLTQIEHAPGNRAYLIASSTSVLDRIIREVETQLSRYEASSPLHENWPRAVGIVVAGMKEGGQAVDAIAPEHLTICMKDHHAALDGVNNAGAILIGDWTPESAGDYAIGPSHTLPTAGAARFQSPVNVLTFLKFQSVMSLTRDGFEEIADRVEALAKAEGFPAHAYGSDIRRRTRLEDRR